MNKILLLAFCILSFNVQSAEVKQDTVHRYIIDKQVVTNFNGSQLEGKTVSKYMIALKKDGNKVIKNHVIYTEKPKISLPKIGGNISLKGKINSVDLKDEVDALVIVDGIEMGDAELQNLKPETIASINVYKAGSEVAKSYGKKGEQGVVIVTTNANKDKNEPTYLIDGKVATKSDLEKLPTGKIASMTVNKKEGNRVILITTKK